MKTIQCKHLSVLDEALRFGGHRETYRGQPWSRNCREWVYYSVVLDLPALRAQFALPDSVQEHKNTDPKSGQEAGFVCSECHDGVMGRLEGAPGFPGTPT